MSVTDQSNKDLLRQPGMRLRDLYRAHQKINISLGVPKGMDAVVEKSGIIPMNEG